MKPVRDLFYVKVDKNQNSVLRVNGQTLFLETAFDPYTHAVQEGIVEMPPLKISQRYKNDVSIEKGEKVYFHHFVAQPDNIEESIGKDIYRCGYMSIYCVVKDGKINMIEDYLLVKPVMEQEENYKTDSGIWLKPRAESIPLQGIVCHISDKCREAGLSVGDRISFTKDSEYEMKIEGDSYWRMKLDWINGIILN